MPERQCGECTLCCRLVPVRELDKPANTPCKHQRRTGCRIHHQPRKGFPRSCELWSCAWLVGEPDILRPDHAGWVVDCMPDLVRLRRNDDHAIIDEVTMLQVWVRPGVDPIEDPRLRRLAEKYAAIGQGTLLRWGTERAVAIFPPQLSSDGQWHVIGDAQMVRGETRTGNYLLDRLTEEAHG